MKILENLDKVFIFNPCYILRNDVNRVILTDSGKDRYNELGDDNFAEFIHPVHAMLLSFFDGKKSLRETVKILSSFFLLNEEKVAKLIQPFINNNEVLAVEYDGNFYYYPQKILIENRNFPKRTYSPEDFNIEEILDFETKRYNIPIECTFVLNTTCVTDCIYCYADKKNCMKNQIPFERIQELILETKSLKFKKVDITGGELFLYEHWYELLSLLYHCGYEPYLTTKVPIGEKEILKLKELGIGAIQISLDSIFSDDLQTNLKVNNNYCQKILKTVAILNQNGIKTKIKSVITNQIFDIDRISKSIDYYKQFENINIVELTAPSASNYKTNQQFLEYRLSLAQIQQLKELAQQKSDEVHFSLSVDAQVYTGDMFYNSFEHKKGLFYKRAVCSGNERSFYILPNGDTTVCEETYFNKNLQLGNILNNSIMEMWNSEQAKKLFFISQDKFPKDSYCAKCTEFNECRHKAGICWVDVIAAYGNENWLYPSPECPYAPQLKNKIYCE